MATKLIISASGQKYLRFATSILKAPASFNLKKCKAVQTYQKQTRWNGMKAGVLEKSFSFFSHHENQRLQMQTKKTHTHSSLSLPSICTHLVRAVRNTYNHIPRSLSEFEESGGEGGNIVWKQYARTPQCVHSTARVTSNSWYKTPRWMACSGDSHSLFARISCLRELDEPKVTMIVNE